MKQCRPAPRVIYHPLHRSARPGSSDRCCWRRGQSLSPLQQCAPSTPRCTRLACQCGAWRHCIISHQRRCIPQPFCQRAHPTADACSPSPIGLDPSPDALLSATVQVAQTTITAPEAAACSLGNSSPTRASAPLGRSYQREGLALQQRAQGHSSKGGPSLPHTAVYPR